MKNMSRLMIGLALFALAATAPAATWNVDPAHSVISFSVKHLMISTVRGDFTTFEGTLSFEEGQSEALSVEATADAASVNTRNEKRDAHLKSADFFDAEKYPKLSFKSKSTKKTGEGHYLLTGELTIRGVTKEVAFDVVGLAGTVKDPWGGTRAAATATAIISRADFGLTYNAALEAGGVVIGNEVTITLDVEFVKQPEN